MLYRCTVSIPAFGKTHRLVKSHTEYPPLLLLRSPSTGVANAATGRLGAIRPKTIRIYRLYSSLGLVRLPSLIFIPPAAFESLARDFNSVCCVSPEAIILSLVRQEEASLVIQPRSSPTRSGLS